jgi:2-polyprenyl-3-methyl-5-hydroxy-6-metoxy-1,4-benzoquinol methylase
MDKYEEFHKKTKNQNKIIEPKNFTYRLLFDIAQKYVNKSKFVLDIGCGAGTISLYLSSRGINVLGIDISKRAIEEANKSAKNLKLENATFEIINFPTEVPKGIYDLVLCFEVLEHLKDDTLALKNIYKLLKKNGILIISVPSKNAPLYKLGYATEFDERVGHLRRYTRYELLQKLKANRFEIIETRLNEGILRNFLFLNPYAGQLVRGMKSIIGELFTFIDNQSVILFGESQIIIVARKK